MIKELITIRNYAVLNKVTTQCIYNKIKKGVLKSIEIDGVKFIKLK